MSKRKNKQVSYYGFARAGAMEPPHKFVDDVAVCKAVSYSQAKKIFSRLYEDIRDDEIFKITGNFNSYGVMILTDY